VEAIEIAIKNMGFSTFSLLDATRICAFSSHLRSSSRHFRQFGAHCRHIGIINTL